MKINFQSWPLKLIVHILKCFSCNIMTMGIRRIEKLLCLLIFTFTVPFQGIGQPSYIFHHLTTENGLSNSNVQVILQDSLGFLWIGTESGLNRYDGYGFKVYTMTPESPNSLLTDNILGLQEDGLGNIWINSGYSYAVYKRDKDYFVTDIPNLLQKLGIQVDRNYKIYVDKKKDLWVLSEQKAFFYNTRKKKLKVFGIKAWIDEIVTTEFSDDGHYLYGILKSGRLLQLDKYTGTQVLLDLKDFIKPEVLAMYNKIYVDSHSGVWLYSGKTNHVYYRKDLQSDWKELVLNSSLKVQNNIVLDILDDDNGNIWIGTDHAGLFIYNTVNGKLTNLLHEEVNSSIASNNVTCLFRDDNGVMWMGHNKKGISYYHDSFHKFTNVANTDCKDVSVVMQDRKGRVWLGTDGNGLYLKQDALKSQMEKIPMQNNAIVSLVEDRKGRVWIGTYLNGLFCYENGKIKHFTKENSLLTSNDIWGLKEDRFGNLWIGTLGGGLLCFREDGANLDSLIMAPKNISYALDMCYDGGDKLYVGTTFGLDVVDVTSGKLITYMGNYRWTQTYKQMLITTVFKDNRDVIWLGHAQGLTLWDLKKDTLYNFDQKNGLCNNIVRGIVEDGHGKMWVTTSNGLSVLSVERDAQGVLKISSRNFSTKDGLKTNYFNNHSICKLSNGDILLGGTEGYTIVNPNKLTEKNQLPAKVIFTGLSVENNNIEVDSLYNGKKLLNRSMEQTSSLTFSYKDKIIAFQFTAGDLLNAERVKYAYKLEGFNDQWITTRENKVAFSSLFPGDYKLFIKACNSDGVWNKEATILDITVTPPFYFSAWAISIYTILVIGLIVFTFYRIRKRHRTKLERQKVLLEREQKEYLNEMKLRFFTNISHDLRTPLTLILTPLQTILSGKVEDGLRRKLNTINRNAEQLLQLINTLLDFRKLDVGAETLHLQVGDFVNFVNEICVPFNAYAIDRKMDFSFSSEIEKQPMQFDRDKVKKILFNLLSNAFKYTPDGGRVSTHVFREEDQVCVSISDSGQGINDSEKKYVFERFFQASQKQQDKTGSGIGLHIVKEYVQMHKGTIEVMDNDSQGTVFTFKLPILEADGIIEELDAEKEPAEELVEEYDDQNHPTNPILLFVDDNKDLCEFMADNLSDDYSVLVAFNGQEALEMLEKNDVSIVISDVMMPVMSGTELCNRIKTNVQWSHIPVILLTARTAEEYQIEGLKLGADDYLTKPFNFNVLKLRIRKFMEWTKKSHLSFSQKMDVSPGEITITPLDEQLIDKAIKVVEEHIEDVEFSVEDLSAAVGLTRGHLYKKLMSITGKGPAEFIRIIRLKRGRQLLEKSQLHIAEIAYAVGFNSPKRFSVNFKNEFGLSPSDYLRKLNNPD